MEKGRINLSLDELKPLFDKGKLLISEFIQMRKKHTYAYDFEDNEIKDLINKLTKSFDYFLKYIILLHQYNEYNNRFNNYIFEPEVIKYFADNKIITPNAVEQLDKFDELNFIYLYKYIEMVYYDDYEKINKIIENHVIIDLARKKYIKEDISKVEKFFLITNSFDKNRVFNLYNKEENEKFLSKSKEVKTESNDVIVKINNIIKKLDNLTEDDIDDLYEIVIGIYIFCSFVNKNNYKFSFNVKDYCYNYNVKQYCVLINKTIKDINVIFDNFKDTMFIPFVLKNTLSIEDILKYKNIDMKKETLKFFLVNNTPFDTYNYLINKNFTEKEVMNIITLNGNDYSKFNVSEKYYSLIPYIDLISISKLTDRVLDYLLEVKSRFVELFKGKYYEIYFEGFLKILKIHGIVKYVDLIKKMDFEQVRIFDTINRYLGMDEIESDTIALNVIDNIKGYIDDEEEIINKIPIMLDYENNKIILTEFLSNGLNIDNMKYFDGTVFCYPSKYVLQVIKVMKNNNVDIMIDNKLNPNFIKYVTQLIHKQTRYELPPLIIYRPNEEKE